MIVKSISSEGSHRTNSITLDKTEKTFGKPQYHIKVRPGEVGKYVLIPGDPDRVLRIAQHLEGSVRPETFLELVAQQGVPVPFDPLEVREKLRVDGSEKTRVDYLARIMVNYAVLKSPVRCIGGLFCLPLAT
jgi:hypothetical protein